MALEISGKIIQKLPKQSGVGKTGNNWQKQEFVMETNEQYPKKICIQLWGDKIDELERINIGDPLTASISIESREFNGRWYTDIRAWRLTSGSPSEPTAQKTTLVEDNIGEETTFTDEGSVHDDLPF